eukprot:COSAG01_NODE_27638_length_680_cov_2.660929_1_plen_91_part_10
MVYLHGNVGCRLEALEICDVVLGGPAPCSLCTFDFGGCGASAGDTISLGLWEAEDVCVTRDAAAAAAAAALLPLLPPPPAPALRPPPERRS